MFGEFTLMGWMGGAIVLAIGGGAGFFLARQIKDKHTLELEQQLESTQNKLNEYQEDVNRHFLKTSLLFNKLTDNYRDVYEHLATGAQKLCTDKPQVSALDLPEAKILSAAIATDASVAITTEEQIEAGSGNTTPAALAEDTEQSEQIMAEQITKQTAEETSPTETSASESTTTESETIEIKPSDDTPAISEEELKALEANEEKKAEEEDIHLGAESTPGAELEHHKTHPSIH